MLGPLSTPARPSSGCTKWWVVSDKKENAEDDTIGTQHSGSLPGEGWQTLASARQPGGPRLEGITAKPGYHPQPLQSTAALLVSYAHLIRVGVLLTGGRDLLKAAQGRHC